MFQFNEFLSPVDLKKIKSEKDFLPHQIGSCISINTDSNQFILNTDYKIAIIGVDENRGILHENTTDSAPDEIRKYLYRLTYNASVSIVDLGNLKNGFTLNDTYFALKHILKELLSKKILPLIIGGSRDLTYANFLAYENKDLVVNLVAVDSSFRIGNSEVEINAENYLSKIILFQPNFLFNYSNIGYQSYFVSKQETDLLDKLYFDTYRLGVTRTSIQESEPIIRNADFISFDIASIRQSDAPGNFCPSPNGFFGDEACVLSRYAGLSDKLSSIGFYGYAPEKDIHGQTAHLYAQIVWHFIEGVSARKNEFPLADKLGYTKYTVSLKSGTTEIVFYKSKKSERWWMDIPYPSHQKIQYERQLIVPCSYNDYKVACDDEMPDRWWLTFQKLR
ncbi:MAG: formimidoylglutamase [Flavobacteriales bacterium]|nr:formimidoylglutamase [Flavobacteriales bacterium]